MKLEKKDKVYFRINKDDGSFYFTLHSLDNGSLGSISPDIDIDINKFHLCDDKLKNVAFDLLRCWCAFGLTPDLEEDFVNYFQDLFRDYPAKNKEKIEDLIDELAFSLETIDSFSYSADNYYDNTPELQIQAINKSARKGSLTQRLIELDKDYGEYDPGMDYILVCIKGEDCFNKFFEAIHEAYVDHLAAKEAY